MPARKNPVNNLLVNTNGNDERSINESKLLNAPNTLLIKKIFEGEFLSLTPLIAINSVPIIKPNCTDEVR
jgi:hypothetical protein